MQKISRFFLLKQNLLTLERHYPITLKNKIVLITGADGFIDSRLAEALVKEGTKVKESKYRDRNQRPFILHCEVLMPMAIPPFRHCEEVASTDVAISGANDRAKRRDCRASPAMTEKRLFQ